MRNFVLFHVHATVAAMASAIQPYLDNTVVRDSSTARTSLKSIELEGRKLIQTHGLPVENALVTTDHKGYEVRYGNNDPTHARNLTMESPDKLPQRGSFPNGFNLPETNEAYNRRTIRIANETADYLLENPKAKVHFQEFMITRPTRDLFMDVLKSRGINHQLEATRSFSVATLLPQNSPFHVVKEIMREINSDPQLIGRFLVFQTSESYYEINGHLPFRGTEVAFKKIYSIIFKHAARNLDSGVETVSINAYFDTNLSPEAQKQLHKEAYEEFVAKRSPELKPIQGKSLLLISKDSHLQNEGANKKVLVSVDSYNETIFQRSERYGYEQKTAPEPTRFGYYASMIIGSGVVVANTLYFAGELAAEGAIAQETGIGVSGVMLLRAGFFSGTMKQIGHEEPLIPLKEHSFGRNPS